MADAEAAEDSTREVGSIGRGGRRRTRRGAGGRRYRRGASARSRGRSGSARRRRRGASSRGSVISRAMTAWRPATSVRAGTQSRGPRKSESDDDHAGRRPDRADEAEGAGRRGLRRRPPRAARWRWRAAGRASRGCRRPAAMTISRPAPNVTTPSRLPRRAAKRPTTSAAPSATSALRRSAVPKCIDGELVEQEPRGQLPVRHVLADLRDERPGGGVPVDLADVVARLVRTDAGRARGRRRDRDRGGRRSSGRRRAGRATSSSWRTRRSAIGPGPGRAAVRSRPPTRARSAAPDGFGPRTAGHAVGSAAISRRGAGTSVRDALDDRVGGDAVGQGRVAQDQAMAEDVGREGDDVGRQDVAAAVEEGHGAGAVDEVDRAARAGAVRDVASRGRARPSR